MEDRQEWEGSSLKGHTRFRQVVRGRLARTL